MICAEDGCDTVLSIYNPGRYCALHEGPHEYLSTLQWATARRGQEPGTSKTAAARQRRRRARLRNEEREAS